MVKTEQNNSLSTMKAEAMVLLLNGGYKMFKGEDASKVIVAKVNKEDDRVTSVTLNKVNYADEIKCAVCTAGLSLQDNIVNGNAKAKIGSIIDEIKEDNMTEKTQMLIETLVKEYYSAIENQPVTEEEYNNYLEIGLFQKGMASISDKSIRDKVDGIVSLANNRFSSNENNN
ncbi:MAG: hypothetical protein RR334_03365 [Clostridia bacterium]